MIDQKKRLCTGCSACLNICPKGAIAFDISKTFFYEPIVNYDLCIKCQKCITVCPSINYKENNTLKPKAFAVAASDSERKNSTSGAFFSVLAKYVLKNKGLVCGASWTSDWMVEHIIIDKIEDLSKLRFSKYVQSNLNDCFNKIAEYLESGKLVLFTGTPCQNAGLLCYLQKTYSNLITLDLLCHGSPSPKIWNEYLNTYFDRKEIRDICFRSKEYSWTGCGYASKNTKYSYIKTDSVHSIGPYYDAFLKHIISTDACLDCKYKYIPRPADFTAGDFWYYWKYDKTLSDNKGLNIVLANNNKAEMILDKIKSEFKLCRNIELQNYEDIEISEKSRMTDERVLFYKNLNKYSLKDSLTFASRKHFDIGLLSFFNGMNYGSSLVAFATNKIFEKMGYSVLMVNKPYNAIYPYDEENKSYDFARKHFYLSYFYERNQSCIKLNNIVDTFVVGSDTQWWWNDVSSLGGHPWLDFAESSKRKISFATSFANDETDIPQEEWRKLKYLYSRFDGISVRERSGLDILSKNFNVKDAVCLIDPTLIAEPEIYNEIVEESSLNCKNYIFAYILDLTPDKELVLKFIAEKLGKTLRVVPRQYHKGSMELVTNNNCSISDFLYLLKNADYVITDSFHGTSFSVIFEKNFVCFQNNKRGNSRFEIFKEMELGDHILDSIEKIYDFDFNMKIDFTKAKLSISEERKKALIWLEKMLKIEKNKSSSEDLLYDYLYQKEV